MQKSTAAPISRQKIRLLLFCRLAVLFEKTLEFIDPIINLLASQFTLFRLAQKTCFQTGTFSAHCHAQ